MRAVFFIGLLMFVNNVSGEDRKIQCEDFLYRAIVPKVINQVWDPDAYLEFLREHRSTYRVYFKNEKVYDSVGRLFTTLKPHPAEMSLRAVWFMAPDGAFYMSRRKAHGGLTHSVFAAHGPIAAAGEIIVINGVIKYINDEAKDYDLDRRQFREAYHALTRLLGWRHLESAMVDYTTAYPKSQTVSDKKWRLK